MVAFHETLSDRTVYMRYLHPMMLSQRVAHDRLAHICHCDYNREIALVVEDPDTSSGPARILAVGRISKLHGKDAARLSLLVSDHEQGRGIGSELVKRLIQVSQSEKIHRIEAVITQDNTVMRRLFELLGFEFETHDRTIIAHKVLGQ